MSLNKATDARGFSLIETVFTLAIIATVSVGLISVSNSAFDMVGREAAMDQMRRLERGVSGDPVIVVNNARTSFGYIGDMGNPPTALEDLWIKGSQPAFTFDTAVKTGAGWNGPYVDLEVVEYLDALGLDAWGTDLFYDDSAFTDSDFGADVTAKLTSFGGDGVSGGNDDITLQFFDATTASRVQGFARDEENAGVPGVGVTVNYPQNGSLTSSTIQTDTLGYYFFNDIPFGNRSLTVEPKLVLAPDTAIVTGNDNNDVEFVVKNFASTDTDITSISVDINVSPPAYFEQMRVGNTTVFNSSNPRFASGDTVNFSAETIDGTGQVTESIPIRIQSAITDIEDIVIGDIGRGSSLTIEMNSFEDQLTGNGTEVDMTGVNLVVTFSDGSVVVVVPTDPTP